MASKRTAAGGKDLRVTKKGGSTTSSRSPLAARKANKAKGKLPAPVVKSAPVPVKKAVPKLKATPVLSAARAQSRTNEEKDKPAAEEMGELEDEPADDDEGDDDEGGAGNDEDGSDTDTHEDEQLDPKLQAAIDARTRAQERELELAQMRLMLKEKEQQATVARMERKLREMEEKMVRDCGNEMRTGCVFF